MAERVRRWSELTAAEAAEAATRDPVLVLPLAAVEQHGPHLPLSTDVDIGAGILERAFSALAPELPVFALPTISVGASAEHEGHPGTLSKDTRSLAYEIRAVGASVARTGVRRLGLANSHGGNRSAMEEAGLALRRERGMLVVKASWFRFGRPSDTGLPDGEWIHGLHGGAVETAMMLHLRPELVRKDRLQSFPSVGEELDGALRRLLPEGEASFAWLAEDLNPAGVAGDARLATPELGARLVHHYGDALADVIADAHAFPLDRPV